MSKASSLLRYEKRINDVLDFIFAHLGDELDLYRLAQVANMSVYHWHRVYRAMTGESVIVTVKRMRLHHGADKLANTRLAISKIAADSGYPNVQSFTRIFRDAYGMTPDQYRHQGNHTAFSLNLNLGEDAMNTYSVDIVEVEPMRSVGVPHQGSYMEIGKAFEKLYVSLASRQLMGEGIRLLGVYYDDPSVTPVERLRSVACAAGLETFPEQAPLEAINIEGGKYAKLRYIGPYSAMHAAYQWLYSHWLVDSGYELGNNPCFEEYLNNPQNTAPADLQTDIYLSLAS